MSLPLRLLTLAFLWLCIACSGQPAASPPPTAASSALPVASAADPAASENAFPKTPAEAQAMKQAGSRWSDCEIRVYYNRLVLEIPAADNALAQTGKSAEERARAAYEIRHNARITCRAMMENPTEVAALRARDLEKYGNPDGPTFEQLMQKNRDKGLEGDAVFEEIISSSQRTDEAVNKECGIRRQ